MAKEKKDDWDDGRTIAPMTGEELPPLQRMAFSNRERKRNLKNNGKSDVTRKEQNAMIRAMFAVMLPRLLVVLLGFGFVGILLWLWLS